MSVIVYPLSVRVAECPLLTEIRQQHMLNEKQFY